MKLYDYFRSTASYRVRIALKLKGLSADIETIHLVNNGGEQHSKYYQSINPQQLVPSFETEQSLLLHQSLAIIDYLDATHPTPPLYPSSPYDIAVVKSLALSIACDIHPLNNLRVLNYLKENSQFSEHQKMDWYHHWIAQGFSAIEKQLATLSRKKSFCFGERPTVADICLIPQVYNANRFNCDMSAYPRINEINTHCLSLEEFSSSSPN